jgi:hypothetical protein
MREIRTSGSVVAAMLAVSLVGESPIGGDCPVATVVLSGDGEGDQPVGSPEENVFVAGRKPGRSTRRQTSRQAVAEANRQPRKRTPPEVDGGIVRTPNLSTEGEGLRRRRRNWVRAVGGFSGVLEDGMSTKIGERKHGTTRGSPRRSRTAKAPRINRRAAKSWCACEWGGWGRLSEDGPGQYNPDRSEGPWGRAACPLAWRCFLYRGAPTQNGIHPSGTEHEGQPQTTRTIWECWEQLNRVARAGRHCLTCQPSSRTGENPPYGMIGGAVETSASFEVRSAPLLYPTRALAPRCLVDPPRRAPRAHPSGPT